MRHYYAWVLISCLLITSAHAERIRDMSLPVEQSLGLPDHRASPAGIGYPGTFGSPSAPLSPERPDRIRVTDLAEAESGASTWFMDQYCSVSPAAQNAMSSPWLSCLEDSRQQICHRFQQLPPEIQYLINRQLYCDFLGGEQSGDEEHDANIQLAADQGECWRNDMESVTLMRKHWGNESYMHAILFFQSEVSEGESTCRANARGKRQ